MCSAQAELAKNHVGRKAPPPTSIKERAQPEIAAFIPQVQLPYLARNKGDLQWVYKKRPSVKKLNCIKKIARNSKEK